MSYRKPVNFPNLVVGELRHENNILGVHEVSTTQRFELGTRYRIGDKIYRYGLSVGVCRAGRGVQHNLAVAGGESGPDWVLLSGSHSIGDMSVTIAAGTHVAYTKNQLAGGQILISDAEIDANDNNPQNRTIAGNEASASGAILKVYLDTPLSRAVTILTRVFLMPNFYANLVCGDNTPANTGREGWQSHAGVPAAYVSASGKYFWVQTWGPIWIAMQGTTGKTQYGREVVFRHDGTLDLHDDDDTHAKYAQHAGYILDKTGTEVGATFIMLQVNP